MPARRHATLAGVVVASGIAAGLIGALLTWLLHLVHWLGFSVVDELAVAGVPRWRLLVTPTVGGILSGAAWWWLRSRVRLVSANHAAREPESHAMTLSAPLTDATIQIVAVAAGASMGREGAPRQGAAALAEHLSLRAGLDAQWRGLVVAAGAGAGLAAVYNVPLAGIAFALEIVLVKRSWRALAVAAPMSAIATVVAWIAVPRRPTYNFPAVGVDWHQVGWVLLAVPVIAVIGAVFDVVTRQSRRLRPPPDWRLPVLLGLAGLAIGLVSFGWQFEELGNGLVLAQVSFTPTGLTFGTLLLMGLVKPILTAMFFAAGAEGGRLTPALSTGAALGAGFALWQQHPSSTVSVLALIVGVGVIAVSQRAPIFAGIFGWELTGCAPSLAIMLLIVAILSHLLARWGAVIARNHGLLPTASGA